MSLLFITKPQIDIESGALKGLEALIRWEHTKIGPISPAEYIPLAEDTLLTFAIGTKPSFLGFLVIIASEPISDEDIAAIEHACTVISLEMIKEQAIFETEHSLKGQFIDGLLSGEINEQLINQAHQLQLNEDRHFQVITIQLDQFHQPPMNDYQGFIHTRRNLLQLARNLFLSSYPLGIVVSKYNHIIVLLSYNSGIHHQETMRYIQERSEQFLKELQVRFQKKFTISIGIGRMIKGIEHVHKSSDDSTKCIQFIKNFKLKKKIVHYSELGS
jgi:GGDEF domain-containing protein